MSSAVRVRFAPSPTGLLHIGGLRTALYNYLFAKHHNGAFILRIEDTDRVRHVREAEQDILDNLVWSGLIPDEGPAILTTDTGGAGSPQISGNENQSQNNTASADVDAEKPVSIGYDQKGEYGPYRQSERAELYKKYVQLLVESGNAYYAFDTVDEIEAMRERFRTPENPTPKYDAETRVTMRNSLTLTGSEVQNLLNEGAEYVIRLKVPAGETVRFNDLVRESVSFETDGLDDQVLLKADGMPTYHLANVVDDHLMNITHVIRGEEWLSSAPKHILLYRYLGWDPPAMAHLPLIMSPSGGKLSKRKAEEEGIPVNVRDYRSGHFEPEALINFLAFLGWNPGDDREFLTLPEMIEAFRIERVGKSGAIFDYKKLLWFNEHVMRERDEADLARELLPMAAEKGWDNVDEQFLKSVIHLLKERVSRLPEFLEAGRFYFEAPSEYDEKAVHKAWKEGTSERVAKYQERISLLGEDAFVASELKDILTKLVEEEHIGFGKLMMPVRVAVTGAGSGPDLFESLELLGRDEVLRRLDSAITKLG